MTPADRSVMTDIVLRDGFGVDPVATRQQMLTSPEAQRQIHAAQRVVNSMEMTFDVYRARTVANLR